MKLIRQCRRLAERNTSRLTDIAVGLILGAAVVPLATLALHFYVGISNTTLAVLCSVQSVLIVGLILWLVLLRDRLDSRETFIREKLPGSDVDEEEEYQEGFDLGSKSSEDKK